MSINAVQVEAIILHLYLFSFTGNPRIGKYRISVRDLPTT